MTEAKISLFEKSVGDRIEVDLKGFGTFSATLQRINGSDYIFMFDDCIARQPMNDRDTNNGGFENSALNRWIHSKVLEAFPENIKTHIVEISIPTIGMIFGHDDAWCNDHFVADEDEQFLLMKRRQNRIACYDDDTCWWRLRNAAREEVSAAYFAGVNGYGDTYFSGASNSYGVRPVFTLTKPTACDPVSQETTPLKDFVTPDLIDLVADLAKKERKNQEIRKQISNMKKYKEYDDAAVELKRVMDSFTKAGFTDLQAFELVSMMFSISFGGKQ